MQNILRINSGQMLLSSVKLNSMQSNVPQRCLLQLSVQSRGSFANIDAHSNGSVKSVLHHRQLGLSLRQLCGWSHLREQRNATLKRRSLMLEVTSHDSIQIGSHARPGLLLNLQ